MPQAKRLENIEIQADVSPAVFPLPSSERDGQRRAVANAWLKWQCKMVAGVDSGAVYSVLDGFVQYELGHWPGNNMASPSMGTLAQHALEANDVLVNSAQRSESSDNQTQDHVAIPVSGDDGSYVVVMHIAARSKSQQDAVIQLVQWGGLWLGSLDHVVGNYTGTNSAVSVQLVEQVLAQKDLYEACLEAANRLAVDLKCDRVSVGLKYGPAIRLQAISQVSSFDERRSLVSAIEAAMEEAADQRTVINTSDETSNVILTRAHEELEETHSSLSSCTVPLYCNDEVVGAVLLERENQSGFSADAVNHAMKVLAPMGPVLQLIKQEQRGLRVRAQECVKSKFSRDNLPKTNKGKLIAGACALGALGLLFLPVQYNVSAKASIEASDKQVLVAPQAGYIKSASARAGDKVIAGQVIATLENRDLIIEKEKWLGEMDKLDTSLARALSSRDRSELGLLRANKAQIDAELGLIEQKLKRSQLVAPFDGVLVSGDLNQSLGAPVEIGQVLFEVASLESFRLVLEVEEHDVAGIEPNQEGVLRFSALPGSRHTLTTKNIVPVAITRDRKSVFTVEAELHQDGELLRPGMSGIAKVHVGEKPLVWIWTKGIIAKLRLWIWKSSL